jgi:hypothetical protein
MTMRIPRRLFLSLALAALVACVFAGPAMAKPSETPFEIVPGSFHLVPSTFAAGAHEDLTTSFDLAHSASGFTFNDVRNVVVNLPAGFTANNTAVRTCTQTQLLAQGEPAGIGSLCPPGSQIGTISLDLNNTGEPVHNTFPLYNMEVSSFGVAAELGFKTLIFSQLLAISVRPGDVGLSSTSPNVINVGEAHNVSVTVWGVPAAHIHDPERGRVCSALSGTLKCEGGGEQANFAEKPYLANPTSCGSFEASMAADSWEEPLGEDPAGWPHETSQVGPIVECGRVPFSPSIEVQPTTRSAESPTGLDVSLVVPQSWDSPESIATSNLKDTVVTLPQGITINPGAGSGLGACSPAQFAAETAFSAVGAGCPPESKIGSIDIETPVLAETIPGAVYVATPYDNRPEFGDGEHPGGSLLALYVVAKDQARGIVIKVAGKVDLNPVTGQLTTTFSNTPQQPFSKFTLHFRPGATAPLVSPPVCGSYGAQGLLTPWSAPLEPRLVSSTPFLTTQGVHEGPCPAGGVPPFTPHVTAYPVHGNAGAYSPFYLRLNREDGEQEITRFSTIMPPGLTGNLTGIPFCPEAAIQAAKSPSRAGAQEETEPSCPAASRIGHSIVGAGVGTVLAQTPGSLYLAGPYHGAPLSIVSVTSAKVGPFDLGTVVIRFALKINPITAQVEVDATGSDPIPHIIEGIVVHVRDIRVYVDRPNFIINPTSCQSLQVANTITGAGADPANPAGQVPVNVMTPFQGADCANLAFKPLFNVSTSGKTSKASGASLSVKITYPNAPQGTQANIHAVKVELPKELPSRLTTLQKACLAGVFEANPAACPPASVVGHATAVTPILPVPLTGPAYFVSNGNAKFPELVMVLQGYGITIDLHGETFIDKHGITSSTFHQVPDQPVTSFELTLPEGPYSALAANKNLCSLTRTVTVSRKLTRKVHGHTRRLTVKAKKTVAAALKMPTEFVGQNGIVIHQSTPVAVTGCAKAKAKKAKKTARHGKGTHRRRR